MKITVDFVRAEQHWSPDSGEQQNYLVFSFAGKEYSIAVDEADIVDAIRAAKAQESVPSMAVMRSVEALRREQFYDGVDEGQAKLMEAALAAETQAEATGEDGDLIFGGDQVFGGGPDEDEPVADPPQVFDTSDIPKPVEPVEERVKPPLSAQEQRKAMIRAAHAVNPVKQKLAELMAKAKQRPGRTLPKDDMGNPVVPERRTRDVAPSPMGPAPTVVRHEPRPGEGGGDDDAFPQG